MVQPGGTLSHRLPPLRGGVGWEPGGRGWAAGAGRDALEPALLIHASLACQIIPLWGAIGLASVVCGGFMIKYFGGHTEITWSKSLRATYDHQGLSESRVASHNSHFGMREMNKKDISIFPFKYLSMQSASPRARRVPPSLATAPLEPLLAPSYLRRLLFRCCDCVRA